SLLVAALTSISPRICAVAARRSDLLTSCRSSGTPAPAWFQGAIGRITTIQFIGRERVAPWPALRGGRPEPALLRVGQGYIRAKALRVAEFKSGEPPSATDACAWRGDYDGMHLNLRTAETCAHLSRDNHGQCG